MSVDTIRTMGPTDLKFRYSERKFKELSENVYFYTPLMYSCWVMPLSSERSRDTSRWSVVKAMLTQQLKTAETAHHFLY